MNTSPLFLCIVILAHAAWGMTGAYWSAAVCLALVVTLGYALDQKTSRVIDGYENSAKEAIAILRLLKPLAPSDRLAPNEQDVWPDVQRLLHHNPSIYPGNLAGERDAVLWSYKMEGRLPTSDQDMFNICMRYRDEQHVARRDARSPPSSGATWHVLKRVLHSNPNITSLSLETEREAVLWRFQYQGTLPASDVELYDTLLRYRAEMGES